ncbi:ADP-ribosylglycohydrolase [Orpheovirus IHUMI-LCC2]|uniref:ADP-ribosyl glycohydrolase n=1 Tax=Orpheovirus IHUMI-LCC2 TaxID=2023057 RepID=A0A2I2L3W7_9VIRU|nr:ADP-ribosylglycohydrolase [Orpheovirus IHUMI-LCC2]SNW62210.1 ADP-ribosyl glycohydrolase [Orpheovirus IHUMI-LCC2]
MEDRILGMAYALMIGDSLGSRYEFRYQKNNLYNPYIKEETILHRRYLHALKLELGQTTDDTEMTISLLSSIIKNKGYNKEDVIRSYIDWANSKPHSMGKNTRALFQGITTIGGYNNRWKKGVEDLNNISQSNGSLMRASVLCLVSNNNYWIEDAYLSNPHPNNGHSNYIYCSILRNLLFNKNGLNIEERKNLVLTILSSTNLVHDVVDVVNDAMEGKTRDITDKKGWVLHALYAAIYTFTHFNKVEDVYKWCIEDNAGSDTDTISSISGALMGANLGLNKMKEETHTKHNCEVIEGCTTEKGMCSRPILYRNQSFINLCKVYCSEINM